MWHSGFLQQDWEGNAGKLRFEPMDTEMGLL